MWKTFAFASKQHPQVLKQFEIHGKTFAVQAKSVKTTKVSALKQCPLEDHEAVHSYHVSSQCS